VDHGSSPEAGQVRLRSSQETWPTFLPSGSFFLSSPRLFFALIAEDRLYFKVNDTTRPDFEGLGMEPFVSQE
jgi:TfoX N-terminal domain